MQARAKPSSQGVPGVYTPELAGRSGGSSAPPNFRNWRSEIWELSGNAIFWHLSNLSRLLTWDEKSDPNHILIPVVDPRKSGGPGPPCSYGPDYTLKPRYNEAGYNEFPFKPQYNERNYNFKFLFGLIHLKPVITKPDIPNTRSNLDTGP